MVGDLNSDTFSPSSRTTSTSSFKSPQIFAPEIAKQQHSQFRNRESIHSPSPPQHFQSREETNLASFKGLNHPN